MRRKSEASWESGCCGIGWRGIFPKPTRSAGRPDFNPPVGEWIDAYKTELQRLVPAAPGIAELSIGDVARATLARPADNPQASWSLVFYALWHARHVLGVPSDGGVADVLSEAAKRG